MGQNLFHHVHEQSKEILIMRRVITALNLHWFGFDRIQANLDKVFAFSRPFSYGGTVCESAEDSNYHQPVKLPSSY